MGEPWEHLIVSSPATRTTARPAEHYGRRTLPILRRPLGAAISSSTAHRSHDVSSHID